MKYILTILIVFISSSCEDKASIIIDINNYFVLELKADIKYQEFTQDGATGIDLDQTENENLRIQEIFYERKDRTLSTHVELFPKELVLKNGYEFLSQESFKSKQLTGTLTHYRDGTSDCLLWCLYHKNRFLMIFKINNDFNSSDMAEVVGIINKIKIKEHSSKAD